MDKSLQETYAPNLECFGCGPKNPEGLRIRSFARGDEVVAEWTPAAHHQAFPGVLNGGIIGALLDCHSNWTACYTLMQRRNQSHPPCTVTADYAIQLQRPTPMGPVHLVARAVQVEEDRLVIEARLEAAGKVCATCNGTFVAVKPGHPAYYRW